MYYYPKYSDNSLRYTYLPFKRFTFPKEKKIDISFYVKEHTLAKKCFQN